jgi:hypothetical protein
MDVEDGKNYFVQYGEGRERVKRHYRSNLFKI